MQRIYEASLSGKLDLRLCSRTSQNNRFLSRVLKKRRVKLKIYEKVVYKRRVNKVWLVLKIILESVCVLSCFSHVQLLVTLWTGACQVPLSMGFPRQEYWSRLPFLLPRGLPNPGMVKYISVKYSIYCFSIRVGRKGRNCAKTMKV